MKKIMAALISAAACMALSSCVVVNTSDYLYDNYEQYRMGGTTITDEIINIDVNWVAGNVYITETECEGISFEERSTKALNNAKKMRYWYDRSCRTLFIKFCESSFFYGDMSKDLYINVPQGYVFNNVNLDVVSSDMILSNIKSTSFDIDTVSGSLELTTNTTEEIDMDSVSGSMTVTAGNITSTDFNTVSGSCYLTIDSGKQIEMDSVSGDLNLCLSKELGFDLTTDTHGDVDYTMEVGGRGSNYTYGSKELQIDFDSTSGDVDITHK